MVDLNIYENLSYVSFNNREYKKYFYVDTL